MRALTVEDDAGMARLIGVVLAEQGFAVDHTASGDDALLSAWDTVYDLIVLDLGLPDRSGLTVVQALRDAGRTVPILILTGRSEPDDIARGLDVGADDYLGKPFDTRVLRARIRALIRRGGARHSNQLTCGPLVVNRLTRQALVGGVPLPLSPRELRLLEYLAMRAHFPVGRADLLEHVWDMHFDPGTNVVDSLVARVRRKLGAAGRDPVIETVIGFGYRLVSESAR